MNANYQIIQGDCIERLKDLPSESVHCAVTSPPYFSLRDYGVDGQIGLEESPQLFIAKMVEVFEEVRRVLRSDGVCFMNLGDSYASAWPCNRRNQIGSGSLENGKREARAPRLGGNLKEKDLMLIPHRVAIALQDAGWYVRSDMPWVKRSAMPESVTDRPAKALEYVFMLTKSEKYFADMEAVRVQSPTANDTWKGSKFHEGKTAEHQLGRSQKNRDRSLPNNRNGENGNLDATPAGGRNFRNSDLWFSSLREPHGLVSISDELVGLDVNPSGFKDAHFATFPPKLIEPLIKMGTSEKGCCVDCGAPWERTTDVEYVKSPVHGEGSTIGRHYETGSNNLDGAGLPRVNKEVTTTGWRKTCTCETDEVQPCTVLDPFAGAGTTLLVSKRLGRNSIGIELNPDYIAMIEHRLAHWHKAAPPTSKETAADLPLFMEIGA